MNTRFTRHQSALFLAFGSAVAILAGCASGGNTGPTETVRSTAETAPADLQLLCASQTVEQLNITSGDALPVSSARIEDNSYQVNLTYDGGAAICVIDDEGVIRSISAA